MRRSEEPEQSTVSVTVPTTSAETTTTPPDTTITDDEAATGGDGDGALGPILAVAGVLTSTPPRTRRAAAS